jgi:hypothetical protein
METSMRKGRVLILVLSVAIAGCSWHSKQFHRAVKEHNAALGLDRRPSSYKLKVENGSFPLYQCLFTGCRCTTTCSDGTELRCKGHDCGWADELGCWSREDDKLKDWKLCSS